MYSHTSSSVQFDSGKTRTCSPLRMRPLYRFHSSGRWFFGSHCPNSSRKEKTRSLARARSSSRRAPPKAASKPCSAIASSRVVVCSRLREAHAPVAELDHLGEVVPGVDVHERERERPGAEGLLGQPQQHDRVLAATEQQ